MQEIHSLNPPVVTGICDINKSRARHYCSIFNSLFEYLEKYKLRSAHQSGFRANDSCVDQLLSIVHNIYTAFDAYPTLESCGAF